MKRTANLVIAVAVVASLALAPAAFAGKKTIKQTGEIVGDSASRVKLRVTVNDGDPTAIKGFKAKNVITRCDTKNGRKIKRFEYRSLDPITVNSRNRFDVVLKDDDIGLKITLQGKVKKNGKVVRGSIKTNRFDLKNKVCKVPGQDFKTSK